MSFFRPKTPAAYLLIGIAIGAVGGACVAGANQPHMQSALNSLQAARAELVQAAPDKGGYRARAITRTEEAINETERASDTPATDTGPRASSSRLKQPDSDIDVAWQVLESWMGGSSHPLNV